MRPISTILSVLFLLSASSIARSEPGDAPDSAIAHGDAGRTGDLLLRGSVGMGSLLGCCGSDPFWSANLSLRAAMRVRSRFAIGLEVAQRVYASDGNQRDGTLLLQGQFWFWKRAYVTLGAGLARVVENADNGAGPMFHLDSGVAAGAAIGFEVALHRNVALTLELAESITRYEDHTYQNPSLTLGLTFGARTR